MLIDCGANIFVGDHRECWPWGDTARFDRVIHIWRQSDRDRRVACGCSDPSRASEGTTPYPAQNLFIHWREGETLDQMSVPIREIARFAAPPDQKLLVHCAAGHCRSPHVAVLAGMARGADPIAMIDRINRGQYQACCKLPGWYWETLTAITKLTVTV